MEDKKEHRNTLPKGFWLNEYEIESVLGKPGGFGITYLAMDTNLRQKVAVKEYLPTDFAIREGISTVYVRSSSDADSFQWGLKSFIEEARALARFSHPNIVRVLRFFEANGTAYMVMEYQEGQCFTDYLKTQHTLNEQELLAIIDPLLFGLAEVHKAGLLHRDIKPNNIYIRNDGTPVLLDFGSARYAVGKTRSVTSIVTPGYAPLEQYDNAIKDQGPWSDIYALGAVMYHAIHGEPPPAATRRVLKDPMIPAVQIGEGKYNESLLKAIDWALQVSEENRPQSVEQWRHAFLSDFFSQKVALPLPPSSSIEKFWSSPQLRWWCLTALSGLGVILLVALWVIASLYYGGVPSQELQAALAKEQAARAALENELKDTKALLDKEQKLRKQKELLLAKVVSFEERKQIRGETGSQNHLGTNNYYDVVGVGASDTLRVRSLPGALSPLVDELPPNGKCVAYLGQFRIVGQYVWVLVQYRDKPKGWVNSQFLIENRDEECKKLEVQTVNEEKKP